MAHWRIRWQSPMLWGCLLVGGLAGLWLGPRAWLVGAGQERPPSGTVTVTVDVQSLGSTTIRVHNGTADPIHYRRDHTPSLERPAFWGGWVDVDAWDMRKWYANLWVLETTGLPWYQSPIPPGHTHLYPFWYSVSTQAPGRYRVCFRGRQGTRLFWQPHCSAPFRLSRLGDAA